MTNAPSDTDAHRYPIGRFERQPTISADARAEHVARIAALPSGLTAALQGISEAQFDMPYRQEGWTIRQLVHHVADSHLNAYIRLKLALTEHEPTIKPYDQDAWVELADVRTVSPQVSLAMLTAVHERWVATMRGMTEDQFGRSFYHPENGRMTVDQMLALYAWHGDHHVAHIVNALRS
ncbi:MAG TPA: putative metal-dependent hydrolase [Gemmatimonas sp.]|uniref:YfiT family bacillithiol transferase n=1 Tax=Gemmatimonas sp. TaxID=1962908 RepID=UPI002ED999DA